MTKLLYEIKLKKREGTFMVKKLSWYAIENRLLFIFILVKYLNISTFTSLIQWLFENYHILFNVFS
jgi:hypothetical protein